MEGKPIPFNGIGVFTVPIQFTPGTPILASEANANNLDFAGGFNNTLPRDGQAAMTGVFFAVSGQVGLPGISFAGDPDTGIWRSGADALALVTGGAARLSVSNSGVAVTGLVAASSFSASGENGNYRGDGSLVTISPAVGSAVTGPSIRLRPRGSGTALGQATLDDGGLFTATAFAGNGAALTNLPAGNLTGTVAPARVSGSYTGITGVGALNAGSIASGFGNINIGASTFTGNGSGLTSLPAASLTGTISNARLSGDYSFANLTLSGGITGSNPLDFTVAGAVRMQVTSNGVAVRSGSGEVARFGNASASISNPLTVDGSVTATGFSGSGSGLTGVVHTSGDEVIGGTKRFAGVRTLFGGAGYTGTSPSQIGAAIQGPGAGSPGTYSATVNDANAMGLNRRGSNGNIIAFHRQDDFIAAISITTTAVSYNTTSDARRKEKARDFDSGAIIDGIQIREFDWKAEFGGGKGHGVLVDAETAAIYPEAFHFCAVNNVWMVDHSKLVPVLWRQVQEMRGRLNALAA